MEIARNEITMKPRFQIYDKKELMILRWKDKMQPRFQIKIIMLNNGIAKTASTQVSHPSRSYAPTHFQGKPLCKQIPRTQMCPGHDEK